MTEKLRHATRALYVIVSGGVVQGFATNDSTFAEVPIRIVDFDADDGDTDLTRISMDAGEPAVPAWVSDVERAAVRVIREG